MDTNHTPVALDLCPVCSLPAHASETDDAGQHPECAKKVAKSVFAGLPALTETEWAALAVLCADQAGLSVKLQHALEQQLAQVVRS